MPRTGARALKAQIRDVMIVVLMIIMLIVLVALYLYIYLYHHHHHRRGQVPGRVSLVAIHPEESSGARAGESGQVPGEVQASSLAPVGCAL